MKRKLIITAIAVAAVSGATAQSGNGQTLNCLVPGVLMYRDANYAGCIDRLSRVDKNALTPQQAEETDYFMAKAAASDGRNDAAALLQAFLDRYPASTRRADIMMTIGDVAFMADDYAAALQQYRKVDSNCLDGARAEDYVYRVAYCRLLLADYEEAETGFKALSGTRKYGNAARFYEGYIAYCNNDYARAGELFSGVDRTVSPGNMADYYLCQIRFKEGDYATALSMSRRLIETGAEPHFISEANRIAGESLFNLGQEEQAIPYLNRYAGSTESPMPSSLYILGVSEYRAGEYSRAVQSLEKAACEDNAMAQSACLMIGQAQMKLGNSSAAVAAFEKACHMDFDSDVTETAMYNRAVAQSQGGKVPFGSSISAFEAFLSRYPDSQYAPQVQAYVISGYMTENNYESALRCIEKIKNPTAEVMAARQRVLFTLGTRDYATGKTAVALERFIEAKKLSDYDAAIARDCNLWIGDCYYRQGRYPQASSSYLAFLNSSQVPGGNRVLAYYNLGYSRFGEKRYEDALTDFNRVIKASAGGDKEMLADAYNRVGDCHYYGTRFDRAEKAYGKAYELNRSSGDYALYQKAIMKGLAKDHKGKISTLDEVITRFPSSGLIPSALLAKAESYIAIERHEKAIDTYKELAEKYPSTSQGRNGYLQLAITYMNTGDGKKATETYKTVIAGYPTSEEARVASDDLKRIYADEGRLQEYAAFISTVPDAPRLDVSEMDALTFRAAEKAFTDTGNSLKLKKYIEQYPDGEYESQALYYLASSAHSTGAYADALAYARRLVEEHPDAEAVEDALAIKADVEYRNGDAEQALETYSRLEQRASASRNINAARLGIMRVSRDLGRHESVVNAADRLLSSTTVGASDANEVKFTRAYSLNELGRHDEAEKEWASLAGNTDELYGSKSAYYLAQHYFDTGNTAQARETVDAFINSNPPHRYWLARGFILLSDIERKEGNTFEADEYLKSLRSNYPGTENDIFRMIDQRLK